MEDYRIDILIDKGPSARSIQIDLNPFTLIGATTRSGLLTAPLRARFGINMHLEYYDSKTLAGIIGRSAQILNVSFDEEAAYEIARRSRGTPRIANRLLKRVRDFAQVMADGAITADIADRALTRIEVDKIGLDSTDRNVITTMIKTFGGGPVGLDTLAATTGEDSNTIEDVYEPYLLQLGFINRTPRGRVVNKAAYEHFGIPFNP